MVKRKKKKVKKQGVRAKPSRLLPILASTFLIASTYICHEIYTNNHNDNPTHTIESIVKSEINKKTQEKRISLKDCRKDPLKIDLYLEQMAQEIGDEFKVFRELEGKIKFIHDSDGKKFYSYGLKQLASLKGMEFAKKHFLKYRKNCEFTIATTPFQPAYVGTGAFPPIFLSEQFFKGGFAMVGPKLYNMAEIVDVTKRPGMFFILSDREAKSALAHEVFHAYQTMSGIPINGKEYLKREDFIMHRSQLKYLDALVEMQAFHFELERSKNGSGVSDMYKMKLKDHIYHFSRIILHDSGKVRQEVTHKPLYSGIRKWVEHVNFNPMSYKRLTSNK